MPTTARIAVADTNPMFADGIAACLSDAGYTVIDRAIGEQHDLQEIVDDDPDILLLGPTRPTEHLCFALCRQAKQSDQRLRVIIATPYVDDDLLSRRRCIFRSKRLPLYRSNVRRSAIVTVDAVLADHTLFPPEIAAFAYATDALTSRENEIVNWMSTDLTYVEIAARLGVSQATIKTHVQRILEKLAVGSREDAVRRAHRRGIVNPPD